MSKHLRLLKKRIKRIDNFTDLIILLCVYYVFAINDLAVKHYILLCPILHSLVNKMKTFFFIQSNHPKLVKNFERQKLTYSLQNKIKTYHSSQQLFRIIKHFE